jgi:TolB-like protein
LRPTFSRADKEFSVQFVFGEYALDGSKRELRRGETLVRLEPQVFDVLLFLLQNRDKVVTKDDLIASVWGGRIVSESTLTSRINAARRAVGDSGKRQALLKTYARKGFRFVGDVQTKAPTLAATPGQPASRSLDTEPTITPKWGGKPCVAILPFKNLTDDHAQDYFSDGITEDITNALSKYRSIAVIARNSSFAFKGAEGEVRKIGLTLGAEYLVEGSVRRIGDRVRITARLVETEGGRQLWADRYDRDIQGLFKVQDEITTTIVGRIEPEVGGAERARVVRKAAPALHAWDFFRLGTRHFYKSTAPDNLEAQRLFRRAIELDDDLAEAYGYLCYAIVLSMIYFDAEPSDERLEEAIAIGRKGVELDDRDGLIRFMYGRALLAHKAYGHAIAELETAIELNPSLAVSYCGLADSLAYEGRTSEAIPYFQKAIDLSPHDPLRWAFYSYRALAHIFAREFEAAFEWAQKATRVTNAHYWALAHQVSAEGHLDRPNKARSVVELLRREAEFTCGFVRRRLF